MLSFNILFGIPPLLSFPESLTKIGLKNIEDRIKMIYGPAYGLAITSSPGYGTQVVIQLPITDAGKDKTDERN